MILPTLLIISNKMEDIVNVYLYSLGFVAGCSFSEQIDMAKEIILLFKVSTISDT